MIFNVSPARAPRPGFLLFGILFLTFLAFSPALDNGFTNWDDPEYLLENPLVRSLSGENIKQLFTTHLTGKYHPLTLLSYCLEYKFFQFTPRIYHLSNLLLHLINVILVFCFLSLIVRDIYVVAVTTVLFAVHPLQVEAVAWVSARKDLLCTAFSLAALIMYVRYVQGGSVAPRRCLMVFIFFVLAMLSKAMAVTVPCLLVLIDYYLKRKLDIRNLVEKLPFFALAAGLGWRTWSAAQEAQGFPVTALFPVLDRLFLSGHALLLYLREIIFPYNISCFYPLPEKNGGFFAPAIYLSSFLVLIAAVTLWFLGRRQRLIRFGLFLFGVLLIPVLHLAQINDSIIYDRFVYLASVGVFLILALGCRRLLTSGILWGRQVKMQRLFAVILPAYILYLSFFSWNRCHVWQNSFTLWTDVIERFRHATVAYLNRSSYLLEDNKPKLAILDAYAAVKFSPRYAPSFLTRAQVFAALGEDVLALKDLDTAIALDPSLAQAYLERGNIHFTRNAYDFALNDFTDVLQLNAQEARAFNNRGNAHLLSGRASLAVDDYTKAMAIDPRYTDAYANRAMAYIVLGDPRRALRDLDEALRLDPANTAARVALTHLKAGPK